MTIDKAKFEEHVFKPENAFEILLRGHLWVENLLNRILETQIVSPGVIDIDRMAFRQKVDTADAFGFISIEDGKALRELNRMRNKLAHNLLEEPGQADFAFLVSLLPRPAKAAFDAVMTVPAVSEQSNSLFFQLRYWFFCYVMHLDHLAAMAQYQKDNRTKLLQVTSVRYASKKYGGKEISEEDARRQFDLADPPDPKDSWQ